uniref:Uncharacterized protein n=1 Tax=Strongyloides stercoralis TaxID=6248 RepID=A0A0K0EAV8_STRER
MIFKDIFILSFIFISYIATLRNDNINITLPDYLTMNYIPKYGQKSNLKSNFANNEKLKIINQNKKDIVSIPEYYYNKIELPQKTLLEETKELLEVEKESLTNVLSMFKDVLLCDGKGWCNDKW